MALRQLIDETHSNDGQHLGHHELDRLQHSTHVMLTRGVENTVQLMRVRRANRFVRQQRQHEAEQNSDPTKRNGVGNGDGDRPTRGFRARPAVVTWRTVMDAVFERCEPVVWARAQRKLEKIYKH